MTIKKQLFFLSDSTLCQALKGSVTQVKIDGPLFKVFAQEQQNLTKKKQMIHKRLSTAALLIGLSGLTLFKSHVIDEGVLGLVAVVPLLGILLSNYFIKPPKDFLKTKSEYRENFLAIVTKEEALTKVSKKEIFEALMLRIQMIIHTDRITNKIERIERIIMKIHECQESEDKIFSIPLPFKKNIGEIRNLFNDSTLPIWAEDFIGRHSMQSQFSEEVLEKVEKTPEEILA